VAGDAFVPTLVPSLDGPAVDMVIVTTDELAPVFQQLADYKIARPRDGRPDAALDPGELHGGRGPAGDDPLVPDRRLRALGRRLRPCSAATSTAAVRMIYNSFYPSGEGSELPVDLYYGGLDGDWNADGDQLPGEPYFNTYETGDEVDLAPELHVGRAPVASVAEAQVFVGKILAHERDALGSHLAQLLFLSEVLFPSAYRRAPDEIDGASYSEAIIDEVLAARSVPVTRHYEASPLWPGSLPETKTGVLAAMNTGQHGYINHIGHGFFFDMSVGDRTLALTDAAGLVNSPHGFILNNLNCASAAFDYHSIMERFVTNAHGGAVLAIGSSRAAFAQTAAYFQKSFYTAVFEDASRRGRRGRREPPGVARLPQQTPSTLDADVDAARRPVPLWTEAPQALTSPRPAALPWPSPSGRGERDGAAGQARVCLFKAGDVLAQG
jgi:hypothetical protein